MKDGDLRKIITNTKDSYNKIADKFSQTRQYNWDDVKSYVAKYVKNNQQVLDLGCGNGRLYQILNKYDIEYTGLDISENLIKAAKKKYPKICFQIDDMSNLKITADKYDIVFAIASIHHLPSGDLRKKILTNIYKSLKPNGILIMTNWDLYQPKYEMYFNSNKKLDLTLEENDTLIPWKNAQGKVLTKRYYHAFTLEEIEELLVKCKFKIIENKISRYNIVTIAKK